MKSRDKPGDAYDRALGMLARREYSRRELRTRLERAGYDEDESEAALGRLRDQHYQDDCRFAEMIVRTRSGQGYGPTRVRAELRSHGIGDALIGELMDASGVDWEALALAQLRKRHGTRPPADRAELARRAAFLLRRGFAAATVRSVTHAELGDPQE